MWILYALIGSIASAISSLFAKRAVLDIKDSWMRSFYFSLFGTIIVLPFFIWEFSLPSTWSEIILLILCGGVVVLANYTIFKAYNYLPASTISVIAKLKLVWIMIAGIIIFGQAFSAKNIIGLIIILSASILISEFKNWKMNRIGIIAVVIATLASTGYALLISNLTKTIEPFSLLFYVCAIPMILNAILIPKLVEKTKQTFKHTKFIILNGIFAMVLNMTYILALKEEFARFFFLMEAGLILILFGEYFYLKDKSNLYMKTIAVLLAIAGAILLR
jgi:drug/metabolite transporter (DMT)-like permease